MLTHHMVCNGTFMHLDQIIWNYVPFPFPVCVGVHSVEDQITIQLCSSNMIKQGAEHNSTLSLSQRSYSSIETEMAALFTCYECSITGYCKWVFKHTMHVSLTNAPAVCTSLHSENMNQNVIRNSYQVKSTSITLIFVSRLITQYFTKLH